MPHTAAAYRVQRIAFKKRHISHGAVRFAARPQALLLVQVFRATTSCLQFTVSAISVLHIILALIILIILVIITIIIIIIVILVIIVVAVALLSQLTHAHPQQTRAQTTTVRRIASMKSSTRRHVKA